jgi:hypothetical protein
MRKNFLLHQIWALLERIDAGLITRDPGNARSAEAYDGLRKQLNQSSKNRRIHVSHLLSLSDSIDRGAEYQLVKDRVSDFMNELGISRTSDVSRQDFFEIVGGDGAYLKCIEPAIVEALDDGSMSLVRLGRAERSAEGEPGATAVYSVLSGDPSDDVVSTRGMRVAIGLTLVIVGFFFGWVIATTANDDGTSSPISDAIEVSAVSAS